MARPRPRVKSLCFAILALFLSGAAGLLATEGVLRLLPPVNVVIFERGLMEPSLDPELCYELNPEWPGHDQEGLRTTGRKAPDGAEAILVLGDSIAYGLGLAPEASAAAVMERLLADCPSAGPWQVKNLGVPGYGIEQVCARLRTKGRSRQPASAIYIYCLNDIFMDAGRMGNLLISKRESPMLPERLARGRLLGWLLKLQTFKRAVLLYRMARYHEKKGPAGRDGGRPVGRASPEAARAIRDFLASRGKAASQRRQWGNIEHAYYPNHYYDEKRLLLLNDYLALYEKTCKAAHIRPYLLIVPIFCCDGSGPYIFNDIHNIVKKLSELNGIATVDLQFMSALGGKNNPSQRDCSHPNEYGNELIAQAALRALGFGQCLPGSGAPR